MLCQPYKIASDVYRKHLINSKRNLVIAIYIVIGIQIATSEKKNPLQVRQKLMSYCVFPHTPAMHQSSYLMLALCTEDQLESQNDLLIYCILTYLSQLSQKKEELNCCCCFFICSACYLHVQHANVTYFSSCKTLKENFKKFLLHCYKSWLWLCQFNNGNVGRAGLKETSLLKFYN